MGLTALSVLMAITRFTPWSMAASMTFLVPITLVWMASKGLYSQNGICLSAAAWKTTSTPCMARSRRSRSRTSPRKKRSLSSWLNRAIISDCFNSSRLKITSRLGWYFCSMISTNLLPNDPVPPVTITQLLLQSNPERAVIEAALPLSFPHRSQHGEQVEVKFPRERVEVPGLPELDREVLGHRLGLDQALSGSAQRAPHRLEAIRPRDRRPLPARGQQPSQPEREREASTRCLEIHPRRPAVHVAKECVELRGKLRNELRVTVRGEKRRAAPPVVVLARQ